MKIRYLSSFFLLFVLILGGVLISTLLIRPGQSNALSGSSWRAGKIITDGVFFSPNSLTEAGIQSFLNAKVPDCDSDGSEEYQSTGMTRAEWTAANNKPQPPYTCLKDLRAKVPARSADNYCSGSIASSGTATRSAAYIIRVVSQACNINPKVLLVTLQKEQGLITDDWPWPTQYTKAMGFGCPDSNLPSSVDSNDNGCYDTYEGFFKQVFYAARQFQRYVREPQNFNHRVGQTSNLLSYPNCSKSNVMMETSATAALYNYTPYQPNQAALNNLYGTGNSCSYYGNRNFWRTFNDWFGSTLVNPPPDQFLVGDWDDNGTDTIGIKRGNLYLLDNDNDGRADVLYFYGRPVDTPLVGDWDGDGQDTISIKIGDKYFINNDFDEVTDFKFNYARPQDTAIVGDWDGNGQDTIGIRIGNKYFINNDLDGISESKFVYGRSTDTIIVGDWNGNTVDTISAKIGSTYYINNDFDSYSDFKFNYARSGDAPMGGDFDNNGTDTVGVKMGAYNYFYNNDFDSHSDFKLVFYD